MSRRTSQAPVLASIIAIALLLAGTSAFGATPFEEDGWVTWRVAAVADRPDWCCYRWSAGEGQRKPCDLSLARSHTGATDQRHAELGEVQLWARVKGGRIDRLEMLSPDCVVERTIDWRDLGRVDDRESLAWLTRDGLDDDDRQHQVIAAIAAHEGGRSAILLRDTARPGNHAELRRAAIFWMGQLRIAEMRGDLLELAHTDEDPEIRAHAIFSYAHSPAEDRTDVLIALVENQRQPLQDRKRALFWLAESGDGVNYIQDLLLGTR